ncbi:SHR3 Secretory component protein SHR3 [Candida maltosa Xu316]
MMGYKDIVPIGTSLIIGATTFGLGVIYSNWPYDLDTLWRHDVPSGFDVSLAHYQQWGNSPMYVHYTLHVVAALGLIGHFIKLYKPEEDAKYFEYGSLGLFMIAIIIYLTNLRTGVNSCLAGVWGDVDYKTGLNVMAASQVMIIFVLVGVLVLQGGLYYAQWYDEKLKEEFYRQEAEEAALAAQNQAKQEHDVVVEQEVEEIVEKADQTSASGAKGKKKQTAKKRKS